MKIYKIKISRQASLFLETNFDYIYQYNPKAAITWFEKIQAKINELATFPHKGSLIPEAQTEQRLKDLRQIF